MNTTTPINALRDVWSRIKLSLNDPQWGRKPGSSGDQGNTENNGSQGGNGADSNTRPERPSPSDAPNQDNNQRPNNPYGGNGGNNNGPRAPRQDGPPDFDEVVRKLNDRISELFGKKKRPNNKFNGGNGGGGPQMPSINPKFAASGIVVGAIIAGIVWLGTGIYTVEDGKRGIVQRFGKYSETTEAGLHWRFPWPIESVRIVDQNRLRSIEIGIKGAAANRSGRQSQMLTEDLNIIDIAFAVQYTLADSRAYLFNQRDPDGAVIQAAETAMREVVGKRKMDFLLNQGREEFAGAAQTLMQQLLDRYGTGITISKVNLQAVAAPEAVIDAFQDVVRAQQDRDRQINEGQAYSNRVVNEARGRSSRLLEEAIGYEQSVVARAGGDASRFTAILGEYSKAPGVTRERLYIDMMQSVLGNSSKVLVDQRQGQSLLYLPLDKLMQQTRDAALSGTSTQLLPSQETSRATDSSASSPPSATSSNDPRTVNRDAARGTRENRVN